MMDVVVTLAAIAQETEPSVGDRPVDENPNRTFRDAIDRLREIHREIDDIKVRTKANEIKHAKQNLLTLRRVMKEEDYRAALEEIEREKNCEA